MLNARLLLNTMAAAGLMLSGCASDGIIEDGAPQGAQGKADQINGNDDPSGLLFNAERRLAKLITAEDVGGTFGVPREETPYPDTYWPMVDNGIAVEWLEKDGTECFTTNECDDPEPSPLVKWVSLKNANNVDDAVAWEIKNHGKDVPDVADWFGHCPGWVATAMLNKPIPGPVHVRHTGLALEKCEPGSEGCTKFEIGDVNALGAEAHEGARSRFIGARCDTDPEDIERDDFGRIVRNGKGCKGLNAGALMIVMGNRLKMDKKPFAIDAQNEATTEQIWNQPAFQFTLNSLETLTQSEAANLVASGGESKTGDQNNYLWNDNARGFAKVDVTLHWVTETSGPNLTVINGADSARTTRMVAVIELDRDASDANAVIIGGEYLDDAAVGADRLTVAPFVWIALDVGSDFRHNPFVKGFEVKQLIALALEDSDGGNSCQAAHDPCSEGVALEAACNSCAASVCAQDSFCCNNSWDEICVSETTSICGQTCN